jgi:hypothetical protein
MLLGVAVNTQAPPIQVRIVGDVTVITSDSLTLTAVTVKGHMWSDGVRGGEHNVVFCITHANAVSSKLNTREGEGSCTGCRVAERRKDRV